MGTQSLNAIKKKMWEEEPREGINKFFLLKMQRLTGSTALETLGSMRRQRHDEIYQNKHRNNSIPSCPWPV